MLILAKAQSYLNECELRFYSTDSKRYVISCMHGSERKEVARINERI
jgi:hypothetical protein